MKIVETARLIRRPLDLETAGGRIQRSRRRLLLRGPQAASREIKRIPAQAEAVGEDK